MTNKVDEALREELRLQFFTAAITGSHAILPDEAAAKLFVKSAMFVADASVEAWEQRAKEQFGKDDE